jgi:hypothetical protein
MEIPQVDSTKFDALRQRQFFAEIHGARLAAHVGFP